MMALVRPPRTHRNLFTQRPGRGFLRSSRCSGDEWSLTWCHHLPEEAWGRRKKMETHLGHTTTPPSEKPRNIFFDDPLFEDFAVRALSLDRCPLGEVSTTASRLEDGDRDGWYREWTATADRLTAVGDESAN